MKYNTPPPQLLHIYTLTHSLPLSSTIAPRVRALVELITARLPPPSPFMEEKEDEGEEEEEEEHRAALGEMVEEIHKVCRPIIYMCLQLLPFSFLLCCG